MKKYRITFNAPVTLSFVFICLIATILGIVSDYSITESFFMTYNGSYLNPMTYVRLVTYVFGHIGWEHFAGNAAYLLLLGPLLEEKHGSKNLLLVILVTAVITGLLNNLLFPSTGLCGASGIVFAFILLSSLTGYSDHEIPLTFILITVIYIGQQVADGIMVQDNISNFAHIAGGAVGAVMGYYLNHRR